MQVFIYPSLNYAHVKWPKAILVLFKGAGTGSLGGRNWREKAKAKLEVDVEVLCWISHPQPQYFHLHSPCPIENNLKIALMVTAIHFSLKLLWEINPILQ